MKFLNNLVLADIKTFYAESNAETLPVAESPEDAERAAELKRMAAEREANNADMLQHEFPVKTGEQFAADNEIVLERPVTEADFNEVWDSLQEAQGKEGFRGIYIPENLKPKIWDYVKHTFEAKGKTGDDLTKALKEKIEKEATFFKMQSLDTPPAAPEGQDAPTFPGGFKTEGDYIDWLAKGSPDLTNEAELNDTSDDIDPELLAYLRATNFNGLGRRNDKGEIDMAGLEQQYKSVLEQLNKLNITSFDTLRANIGNLRNADGTIDPAAAARTFNVDPSQLPSSAAEAQGGINTLWDLIRIIIEFATGEKYDGRSFANRFAGAENLGTLPNGNGEATPDFARKALEEATGNNKAILAKAIEHLGVSESANPGLIRQMHASCGLNAGPGTPWCASFISYIKQQAGIGGHKSASSRSFLEDGHSVSPADAKPGDLCIFARGSGGHIGVFVGWDQNRKPIIIGGNQSNQVSIKSSRQQLLGIRRV